MTKSTIPSTTEPPLPRRSPGRLHGVLVFIFRLLLLGVGGTVAALLGIVVAQFYPATTPEPPLVEQAMQGTHYWIRQLRGWGDRGSRPSPEPAASPEANNTSGVPAPPLQLSDAERQLVQTELADLQQELQTLNGRLSTLENRVGANPANIPIESRLQTLEQQLDPNTAPNAPNTVPNTAPNTAPGAVSSTADSASAAIARTGDMFLVTLPSDALFAAQQTTLQPGATAILDSITSDLQRYPGASIRIAAHTDQQGAGDRVRTFEQAKAVEQYLADQLGGNYHWVVVGFGHSRPLVQGSSAADRQRNRRLEIIIDPQ